MTHPNALDLTAMIAASEGICDDLEAEGYSGAIIRRTLRALLDERDALRLSIDEWREEVKSARSMRELYGRKNVELIAERDALRAALRASRRP